MSISFGGLALLSPWSPFLLGDNSRAACRSFVCALVVFAILLILAYLTNPSEASFRAYLTEQSFRQHLTHLDDLADDSLPELDCSDHTVDRATLPFHFANRASVSLRTPKHVFHSFGICTIATTRGAAVPAPARRPHRPDLDAFVSSDSWFIGAFGRWWRGGLVESWYYDAVIRSKDAQAWSSGILGFKALDRFHEYNALPFAKFTPCPRPLLRGSPPKLRNRERSAQRPASIPHRNSSPPPLPKSASLPLHADHRLHDFLPAASQSPHSITDQKRVAVHAPPVAHTISRASSTSGAPDHAVTIAEVTGQIAATQTSIHDLQNQLQEAQNTANQSHDLLEAEVGDLRSRRREEDQRRVDGRARTKTLEDTRRQAETSKREAEKRMKIARNAKDSVMRRVEELELEIQGLKERMEHDRAIIAAEPADADRIEEEELVCELERKKRQVRVAEDVVLALNTRARELEEKIDENKSRLCAAQHRGQLDHGFLDSADPHFGNGNIVYQCNYGRSDSSAWSYNPFDVPVDDVLAPTTVPERVRSNTRPESTDVSRSPELVGLSSVSRAHGRAVVDNDTCCSDSTSPYFQSAQAKSFSPFVDLPTPSAAFIPSSLISVLDSPSAAESKGGFIQSGSFTSSPVEHNGHSFESELDSSDLGRAQGLSSDSTTPCGIHGLDHVQEIARKNGRREKHRSSLNPDAKVFRLTRLVSNKTVGGDASTTTSYDALNPTGLKSSITSSMPSSLLRAFAPSRAEREALQRALGGSTNTSLERLPSLSDVGSIPSSPVDAHEGAQGRGIGGKDRALPAWLQSLPLIRKPNFSPWEDEEPVLTEVKSK